MPYATYGHQPALYDSCPGCGGTKVKKALRCATCKRAESQSRVCPDCGGEKAPQAVRCHACNTALRLESSGRKCPLCGGVKSYQAEMCRTCRFRVLPTCSSCGKRVKSGTQMCLACRRAKEPLRCIDCGTDLNPKARYRDTQRCQACWLKSLHTKPVRLCSVEGCNQPHRARGYCKTHYAKFFQLPRQLSYGTGHRNNQMAGRLQYQPCQVCGYERMKSELHRVNPPLGYRAGNMVAVCARCHDEIERGLTPCPSPFTEDQILHFPLPS